MANADIATTGTTPTLLAFKQDMQKLTDLLNRGQFPASILSPGTITALNTIANNTANTTSLSII